MTLDVGLIITSYGSYYKIGQYSQGRIVNNMVFTSGQLPIIAGTEKMPCNIEKQTRASLVTWLKDQLFLITTL